jgi:hypothetical protein
LVTRQKVKQIKRICLGTAAGRPLSIFQGVRVKKKTSHDMYNSSLRENYILIEMYIFIKKLNTVMSSI